MRGGTRAESFFLSLNPRGRRYKNPHLWSTPPFLWASGAMPPTRYGIACYSLLFVSRCHDECQTKTSLYDRAPTAGPAAFPVLSIADSASSAIYSCGRNYFKYEPNFKSEPLSLYTRKEITYSPPLPPPLTFSRPFPSLPFAARTTKK